ncbi:MAG: terminase small subunit [Synergistaceae bacterium]|jgi:phage terminase small subunit|nr:terminase small subunit [Synergistaceae bacterium]
MGKYNEYGLSPQQENFCQLYVNDPKRNGTKAAIGAGNSEKTASVLASENLTKPKVLQRIKQLEREALEEAGYSPDALRPVILRRLVGMATTDLAEIAQVVYRDDAKRQEALEQMAESAEGQYMLDFGEPVVYIKPTSEWSLEERAAVKSIKTSKGEIQVEIHDQQAALKMLADIVGLTKQSVEISGSNGQPLALNLIFQEEEAQKDEAQEGEKAEGPGAENDEQLEYQNALPAP